MASLESNLRTYLLTLNAVTALVGSGDAARIRPYKFPQAHDDTLDSLLIEVDSEDHFNDLAGIAGLTHSNVTITCRSRTLAGSEALAEAVRINGANPGTGLAGFTGTLGTVNADAWLELEERDELPVGDGTDNSYYDTRQSYIIAYNEAT